MKTTVKNLTNAKANKATTVASVELFEKTVAKAKTPAKKQSHIFATDGTTRITAADKALLEGLRGDVAANSQASLIMCKQAATMTSRAVSLWAIFGGSTVTSASLFAKLIADGYLEADTVSGATAPSIFKNNPEKRVVAQATWDKNQAMFATNTHPLFKALNDMSPSAIAKRAAKKLLAPKGGDIKVVASKSEANLTDAVEVAVAAPVATETHVSAMVKTFMASKPSDMARKALLESVAKMLGFELEGFHSIKAVSAKDTTDYSKAVWK
jgi:hypothetical protein